MVNNSNLSQVKQPWASPTDDVIDALIVNPEEGLTKEEIKRRQEKFGKNQLKKEGGESVLEIAADQFKSIIILLLAVAAVLSLIFGDVIDSLAIVVVILINALIGFFTELQAVRSMEALRELTQVTANVRRGGIVTEINAKEIVPGDILVLNGGDVITADARLIETSKLRINESALTGESLPVDKKKDPLPEDTILAERTNMAFKGTSVVRGSGEAVVITTGMKTELGNISSLVQSAQEESTPLQNRLDELGQKLIIVTLALAAFVAVSGRIAGRDLRLMIETAIALAVASIPEGLPIVATITLARGMQRMANQNALINKLASVETLGATSVIITDKTGTLTENQMTVKEINLPEGAIEVRGEGLALEGDFKWEDQSTSDGITPTLEKLLKVGVLCNDASLTVQDSEVEEAIGEPMEIALKVAGQKAGLTTESLQKQMPEVRKIAFEQETKMMATVHQQDDGQYFYTIKGSPEAVLDISIKTAQQSDEEKDLDESVRGQWIEKNNAVANRGLRVIALAYKTNSSEVDEPYKNLTFLGLVGLMDPPREEVRAAIERCKSAGVRIIMATGDHGETAREIAKSVSLVESPDAPYLLGSDLKDLDNLTDDERQKYIDTQIFARVDPEQKLELINLHQDQGEIVAMTGDGVNDAPALRKADIGVAMGQRGTQVAKEAADMVLEDDFFGTIVKAIEQGRTIFNNIRKFVLYLLSCNISEILVVTLASVLDMPLPILPLQILFLNLVTDVFPALALGMGEGDRMLMEEDPREATEPIMTRRQWTSMAIFGALITATVLIGLAFARNNLGFSSTKATTVSFLILASAQLWHVFDMRGNETNILKNEISKNFFVWLALLITVALLLLAVYIPFLADILSLTNPGVNGWLLVLIASFAPLIISQVLITLRVVN